MADIPRETAALAGRFDGARQSFAFSRARVDEARGHAVVYYERLCYACGLGELVWFRRERADDPWRIMKKKWTWIN